jgi:signal transduction histidine kinase
VVVTLERTTDLLRLRIKDDGRGFDPAQVQSSNEGISGIGLLGMRERIESLGGRFRVETAPDIGTTVTVELPEEGESDEHQAD